MNTVDEMKKENSPPCNANLKKPTKPTKLLHHALTNSNGATWTRQRYCVSRAFSVDKTLRASCATYAVEKTMEIIYEANRLTSTTAGFGCTPFSCMSRTARRKTRGQLVTRIRRRTIGVDVRNLAREVAILTMSRMVLGSRRGSNGIVLDSLREMVDDTLEPRRDEKYSKETMMKVERLDVVVREIIDEISNDLDGDSGQDGDCLARRLLSHEKIAKTDKYLTRDEVVGNSHSALLAGVQTICTTIAGALLHLAENPQMQHDLKEGNISGKDIVKETLRILPPVAGLPRIPTECDVELEDPTIRSNTKSSASVRKCPIPKDQLMVVDLLAFAHAQPFENDHETTIGSMSNALPTLKFDPTQKIKSQAQPWGIGKRKCPAGIISVECISSVIESLAKGGVTWTFIDRKDCVGLENSEGWMKSVSYRPTLSYASPIFINFMANQ